jgi:hypothetical protein
MCPADITMFAQYLHITTLKLMTSFGGVTLVWAELSAHTLSEGEIWQSLWSFMILQRRCKLSLDFPHTRLHYLLGILLHQSMRLR